MDEPPARNTNNCSSSESIVNKISSLASMKEIDKCKGELCCKTVIMIDMGKLFPRPVIKNIRLNLKNVISAHTFAFLRLRVK